MWLTRVNPAANRERNTLTKITRSEAHRDIVLEESAPDGRFRGMKGWRTSGPVRSADRPVAELEQERGQ
jgi:hypothetical protein